MSKKRPLKSFPEINYTYVACHDGGFDSNKGMGANVTEVKGNQLSTVYEHIIQTQFSSRTAPVDGLPPDAAGRIITVIQEEEVLAQGISGHDAITLQPGLWTSELTAEHYTSNEYLQYLFQNLADMFQASGIASGSHVKVYLSLGINIMHKQYAPLIEKTLKETTEPFTARLHDGQEWYVSFGCIEIKPQPFWIMVDQIMRWNKKTGALSPPGLDLLRGGYYVVFDFGSNTFQSLSFINNMVPVHPFCEGIGVWDVLKEQFKPLVVQKAIKAGLIIADPKVQQLMDAYKTGFYRVGKHEPIDLRQEKTDMNRLKVEQRIKTAKFYHKTGEDIRTIICAGGDAEANFPRFQEVYKQNITGEIRFATDDNNERELMFRLSSGGLKGAIRRWSRDMSNKE